MVSAPQHLVASVNDRALDPDAAHDPDWWRDHLPGWTIQGPSTHACRQHPQPEPTTRNPRDSSHPRPVRPATSVGQQRRGGTRQGSAPPVQEAWVITDPHGQPIAAANLTAFDGCPSDIGVLTATGLRGHGLGLHVAAHAASDAIHHCGIAR